jgi:hypothetical protein
MPFLPHLTHWPLSTAYLWSRIIQLDLNPKHSTQAKIHFSLYQVINTGIVEPFQDLFRTLLKPRPYRMRPLIFLCFLGMMTHCATLQNLPLIYPYMLLKFDVTPEEFSIFNVSTRTANMTVLFVLLPLLEKVLNWHEGTLLVFFNFSGALALVLTALAPTLTGYIVCMVIAELRFSNYPTKTVVHARGGSKNVGSPPAGHNHIWVNRYPSESIVV